MTVTEVVERFDQLQPDRPDEFEELAEAVFRFQAAENDVYRRFVGGDVSWDGWRSAPPLPIDAFKLAAVTARPESSAAVFESSGTGSMGTSRHHVHDLAVYDRSALRHFESVFGGRRRTILAHLPSYVDRGHRSSLVYMARKLIETFGDEGSGFFLENVSLLEDAVERGRDVVLLGAAFGLLDLVEAGSYKIPAESVVIETGGMKTHRREVSREELHSRLAAGFGLPRSRIFSEYGMCELLSQCYSRGGDGIFYAPPWMRVVVTDPEDPMTEVPDGERGILRVFDLANVYSVSAILTKDVGIRRGEGFEVAGRSSGAELRGCNFLLERDA